LTDVNTSGRKKQQKNAKKSLTTDERGAIIRTMGAEKTDKIHSFMINLSKQDSERLSAYLRESGMKKRAFMQKAILKYLNEKVGGELEG